MCIPISRGERVGNELERYKGARTPSGLTGKEKREFTIMATFLDSREKMEQSIQNMEAFFP